MPAFFKDIFEQNIKVHKSVFTKYVIVISYIIYLNSLSFFNDKGYLICYNVEVYILVQPEEEYSLILKAKPLPILFDKGKWWKVWQKR